MSDIFLCAGLPVDTPNVAKQLSWTPQTEAWTGEAAGLRWIATRVDDPALWAPAFDPHSRTRAILGGRIAPDEAEWKAAESLHYEGGLACRLVLERWLKGGAAAVERLNGAAQVIVIDESSRALHVWTDRMGFYPAFAWTGTGLVLCSHPDVAAAALGAAGHPCAFDPVTMAEFLRTGTSTHPNTYWAGIRHLDAGTCYRFELASPPSLRESRQYWRPAYFDRPYIEDRREIVERLAVALTSAVRRRTLPRLGEVAVMLSAGADSRTALFAACQPSKVTCFTVYDEPDAEYAGAKQLCAAVGATHVSYQRSKEYYIEQAPRTVRLSGGMWSIDHGHFGGLTAQLRSEGRGVVLTGLYADCLLKGLAYNRRHREFLGRSIPLYSFSDYSHEWWQPFASISSRWQDGVEDRLRTRFATALHSERTQSFAEYLRLSPMSRESGVSGSLILNRECGYDLMLADNDLLELFGSIVPREKLNGIAFGMAVERITGERARHILNSNYGARVGASEVQRVASFVLNSIRRKVSGQGSGQPFDRDPNSVVTAGSWPNYSRVIQLSERLKDWWAARQPDRQAFLLDIMGHERGTWSLDDWAHRDTVLFLRYFTASLWLSQHPEALSRMSKVSAIA